MSQVSIIQTSVSMRKGHARIRSPLSFSKFSGMRMRSRLSTPLVTVMPLIELNGSRCLVLPSFESSRYRPVSVTTSIQSRGLYPCRSYLVTDTVYCNTSLLGQICQNSIYVSISSSMIQASCFIRCFTRIANEIRQFCYPNLS